MVDITWISRFDKKWFYKKIEFFNKEPAYDKKKNCLYLEWNHLAPELDENGKEYLAPALAIEESNFKQYCWSSEFIGGSDYMNQNNDLYLPPLNGQEVYTSVISNLNEQLKFSKDNESTYTLVTHTIGIAEDKFDKLLSHDNESLYTEVIIHLKETFINKLKKEFSGTFDIAAITNNQLAKLEFNLNQEELGALLYILYKADLFNTYASDTTFLNFCIQRFYFSNQRKKQPTIASELRNKFNDAKKPLSKARDEIVKRLQQAFKEL